MIQLEALREVSVREVEHEPLEPEIAGAHGRSDEVGAHA